MDNKEFIKELQRIVDNYKTVYMLGCFGAPVTEKLIAGKAKQLPSWYTTKKQAELRKLIGKGYFAFDCVNLIKGILWGWSGDINATYGGAKYAVNGVPDTNADGMIKLCKDVSTDFSNILPGEAVWMSGHIGVYIGDGKVIESTPSWLNKVQVTTCLNVTHGAPDRRWASHGKIPWIEYDGGNDLLYAVTKISSKIDGGIDVKSWSGNNAEWKAKYVDTLLLKIAKAWK